MIAEAPLASARPASSASAVLDGIDPALAAALGFSTAQRLGVLPLRQSGERTEILLRTPARWGVLLELGARYGTAFRALPVAEEEFNTALRRAFRHQAAAVDAVDYLDDAIDLEAASALPAPADLLDGEDDAPIIRLLNAVLAQAIERRASDVHIEPYEASIAIRYRIDGALRDVLTLPGVLAARLAARVKVMARLNIAEKRVPQDGRIGLRLAGRLIDARVSTLPTQYGERIVMRVLEKEQGPLDLSHIGMPAPLRERFEQSIRSPHGIFLVTGPTGSGKTTTLYSALQVVRSPEVNIVTVEDPVEYDVPGVAQIPVNTRTGLTFGKGLRAILRQDPDIIMVGEIRDLETAEIAVQASLTGHLVFSTLHTNDAAGSITRLIDMGIEPYLVASSLLGALGQRLVRRLCPDCRRLEPADAGERQLLGQGEGSMPLLYRPRGCDRCAGTGYRGRTGIFELFEVDDVLRHMIHDGRDEQRLRAAAIERGMVPLREAGIARVLAGDTSLEEVLRVTRS